jgi:hypothetical protein
MLDETMKQYYELWHRLDAVVAELTARGEEETADYMAVGFFLRFLEIDELTRFVEIAEHAPKDLDLPNKET